MKTLTSDVSVSLFYQVRVQDSVHMSVELCHACAYFVFKFIHFGERFRIYAFTVSVFIVFVWTEGLNA